MKICKDIDRVWEIFDIEFVDRRKLMDKFLIEINNYGVVRSDLKCLVCYVILIFVFVNDMEDNECYV